MTMYLVIAVVVLFFLVIFQIAKASEYVAVLKGEKVSKLQTNKINGFLMVVFLIVGLIGVWYCNDLLFAKTLFKFGSASVQGEKVDSMLWVTIAVTGSVFVATQILLFWFAFKYQEKPDRKVFYFPHNTNLELLWTVVPAIVLTVLVIAFLILLSIVKVSFPDASFKITNNLFSISVLNFPNNNSALSCDE